MNKILTAYGKMYATLNDKGTVDIYDSHKKYFTDICYDNTTYKSEETIITHITNRLQAYNSLQNMCDKENIGSYTCSENWEDLVEDIYGSEVEGIDNKYIITAINRPLAEIDITNNDNVNRIGNKYILLSDF